MSQTTEIRVGAVKPPVNAVVELQEFLTFTLGKEEYGIETLMCGSDMALVDALH